VAIEKISEERKKVIPVRAGKSSNERILWCPNRSLLKKYGLGRGDKNCS